MSQINFAQAAEQEATAMAVAALKNLLAVMSDEEQALVADGLAYKNANAIRALFSQYSVPEQGRHALALRALLPPGVTLMEGGGAVFMMAYKGWKDGPGACIQAVAGTLPNLGAVVVSAGKAVTAAGNNMAFALLGAARALGKAWVWDLVGLDLMSAASEGTGLTGIAPIEGHSTQNGGGGGEHTPDSLSAEIPR